MSKCIECGKSILFFQPVAGLYCASCAGMKLRKTKDELEEVKKAFTPEMKELSNLQQKAAEKQAEMEKTNAVIQLKKDELADLNRQLQKKRQDLLVADAALEFETFSLYTPKYDCVNSEQYKKKLDEVREKQKQQISGKSAVWTGETWKINGSTKDGKTFMSDMSKLMLRAFNNECDAAVSDVKFSNFDRCMNRIMKSFETVNKLGRTVNVGISVQYRKLKIEELTLVHEYQLKKQEEREELRALKEQQREEAKLQKEIAEARKETEKEKKHYLAALKKLREQAETSGSEEEKAALRDRIAEMEQNIENVEARLADIDYRQENQRAGYVYVISNIGSFGEGVYKIGMTRRLDPYERVYELGDASVPFRFDTHAMIFTEDAPKLEAALHQAFSDRRVNMVNHRREYFRVSLEEIKEVVHQNHDKTVEFMDIADAQQYRESEKMRS